MNQSSKFMALSAHERALVAMAILLDGGDAVEYLAIDETRGEALRAASEELLLLELDVRLPYAGTMLRRALKGEK